MSVTSQITMAWNGSELLIEAANPTTGAREKLGLAMSDLPIEMQCVLKDNYSKARAFNDMLAEKKQMQSQRAQEISEHEARAQSEAAARWTKYLSNLAPHVVAWHEHKRSQRIANSQKKAEDIYIGMATTKGQGIDFANSVMPKDRRPRRIEINKDGGKTIVYYPRDEKTKGQKKAQKKSTKKSITKTVAARAKELGHINTNDFTF